MSATNNFPKIANIYAAGIQPVMSEVALQQVARYDLLLGGIPHGEQLENPEAYNAILKRIRKANPNIVIVDFSTSAPYWPIHYMRQPSEDAFLHTASGKRINGWPGTHMLNFMNPETIDLLVERVALRMNALEVDGFFVDCMNDEFDWWAAEIETLKSQFLPVQVVQEKVQIDADGDGKADEVAALNRASSEGKRQLLAALRSKFGDEILLCINAQWTAGYARPYINGTYLEDFIDYTISPHMLGFEWEAVLNLYLSYCDLPHKPNLTTISATPGIWPEYEAARRLEVGEASRILQKGYEQFQFMRFGLATALMGDGYYGFDLNTRWRGQHWWYAEYDAPLGQPLGKAGPAGDGTWRREFEGGLVVVNPTVRELHVKLDQRTWRDYTTGWSGKEMFLPPHDGRIYIPLD
jgi:hypothetical protein